VHIQNLGATTLTVSRMNINQELELPLDGGLTLSPGQKVVLPYKIYEWPQPRTVVLETSEGISEQEFDLEWPKLAILAELERRARNPNKTPVPAPTKADRTTATLQIQGRQTWPETDTAPLPVIVKESPTPLPTPLATPTPTSVPLVATSVANPTYAGSYINRTSNQSGALSLVLETFIPGENGVVEIGGKLRLGTLSPVPVSGTFDPAAGSMTLNQSTPIKAVWIGKVSGSSLKGTFSGKSFGKDEYGLWQCMHSEGLDALNAARMSGSPHPEETAFEGLLAVPIDETMMRFMIFNKQQNRVLDSRVWSFDRPLQPMETIKLESGKTAVVIRQTTQK